ESVARAGNGYAEFVTNKERMDKKILGMLKNAVKPPINDYKIKWTTSYDKQDEDEDKFFNYLFEVEGVEEEKKGEKEKKDKPVINIEKLLKHIKLQQAPYKIPEIYPGIRFIVYCILSKDVQPSNEIILTAKSSDGPMKLNIPIDHVALTGSKIHTLAARKLVQDLEESRSFIHKHLKSKDKTIPDYIFKDYIVNLGIKYNLMSKYTRIGSVSSCASRISSVFLCSSGAMSFSCAPTFSVTESREEEVNEHKKPKIEILLKFLSFQSFDGKFQPKNEFFEFFGKNSLDEFNFENNFENKDDEQQKEKLCTIIGLIYLEVVMMKDFKDECDICYEKSKTALTTKFKDYNEENVMVDRPITMEVDPEIDELQLLIDQINVNDDDNIIKARSYIEIDSDLGT
ncbi:4804_t:CDS:2, partial [Entrophospora sp. SA101]